VLFELVFSQPLVGKGDLFHLHFFKELSAKPLTFSNVGDLQMAERKTGPRTVIWVRILVRVLLLIAFALLIRALFFYHPCRIISKMETKAINKLRSQDMEEVRHVLIEMLENKKFLCIGTRPPEARAALGTLIRDAPAPVSILACLVARHVRRVDRKII
jgi:hypothetical protein